MSERNAKKVRKFAGRELQQMIHVYQRRLRRKVKHLSHKDKAAVYRLMGRASYKSIPKGEHRLITLVASCAARIVRKEVAK